jgi:hypothetical protein
VYEFEGNPKYLLQFYFIKKETMNNLPTYFADDGTPVNPDLFPKPQLCLSCKKNNDADEELVCTLTRLDQRSEAVFECFAYEQFLPK